MTRWLNGLMGGAIAAVLAALISLPLDSPDDLFFNTATVTIGALILGLASGLLWAVLEQRISGRQIYVAAAVVAFGAVVIVAAVSEQVAFSGSIKFILPLAALAFIIAVPVPPILSAVTVPQSWRLAGAPVTVVAALGLGFGLAGMGDSPSGHLSLPTTTVTPQAGNMLTIADISGKTFTVASGESKLTYTVREKLNFLPNESDAVGSTTEVTGQVKLDGPSQLSVDLSTLTSDQDRRDGYIRQTLFRTDPIATFAVDSIMLPASYTPGSTVTQTVAGTANIRGVQGPLTFEVEANFDGTTLQIHGTTDFTWADFNIPPPNTQIAQVGDNVHIEILVVARTDSISST
jgi:polyisoprenoid-binding protein YceI